MFIDSTFASKPLQQLAVLDEPLEAEIKEHKALLSPIRRIPQDILETVFVACLPTAHNAIINVREVPLLLGHICSYWRSVAHSMPTLWTSIFIPCANLSFVPTPAPDDVSLRFADAASVRG
ncbi:hypothetical protein FB451DRAFT_1570042 [Mycena latifolia]|nr:hypothetical protein FB451DRAFT_1570042 [Mycena latifolia]